MISIPEMRERAGTIRRSYVDTLQAALEEAEGGEKAPLGEVLQKCKEVHT